MVLGAGLMAHAQTSPGIRINEVVAENTTGLLDEDGTRQDWIELHNPLDTAVDLNGWHLSDDPARSAQWTFPPTPLPAGGFLVVFASGKNRATPGQPLHTNFKLSRTGEFLALTNPDGQTISRFSSVPPLAADTAFGAAPEATSTFADGSGSRR